jgi:hypothetical protein
MHNNNNVALFISGRLFGYKECLVPIINNLKNKYNIYLFFSINSFSLDTDETIETVEENLKNEFKETIGDIYFEAYKFPKSFVETRLNNNMEVLYNFNYNCLSCFFNDFKNMELIEKFEEKNNISFDVICKLRSEILFQTDFDFVIDKKEELIIRNKHICDIRYWGHVYNDTPLMISDAFAYGNKISMKHYCSTYDWILKNNLELNGKYSQIFEIYLTDSILQHVFYKIPHGEDIPLLSREEIMHKYIHNPKGIKIVYLNDINYSLIPHHIRTKNNFIIDKNNLFLYTHS